MSQPPMGLTGTAEATRLASDGSARAQADHSRDRVLEQVQDYVLWLATRMVDYANNGRPSLDGAKVGGHQASSSSVVTLLTYLFFEFMERGDRIGVKPHASPVYHAVQYLLGNLDATYLTELRAFHGLQSYPSRTKDPDGVDFSTGSVGIGAVAPNFAALTREYLRSHGQFQAPAGGRFISLVGDAELDEGSVWEAIAEPAMQGLDGLIWVVDLNRQSLDRVIPGIRVHAWRGMFEANGWRVAAAKYGKRLTAAFAEPHGELLRQCIDDMPNEVYQRLLRVEGPLIREWLPRLSAYPADMARLIDRWDDRELHDLIGNLGGHDFPTLREAFAEVQAADGPSVVFAYTLKGWRLPSVGDPQNHSVILRPEQMQALRRDLGMPETEDWPRPGEDNEAGRLCAEAARRLFPRASFSGPARGQPIPSGFGGTHGGELSTQEIFGLVLTDISRSLPEAAQRLVTASPDVASSTNLGGWINKVNVWDQSRERAPMPPDINRALKWIESPSGQHLELGISENNLFMMLGQLGLAYETTGELLYPIGTLYDCFVRRGLDAFVYGLYAGAKFIVVGTPSGITLAPEGGAHQSILTPGLGTELPEVSYYEPCFWQELEWILLAALENIRLRKESTYLRLTSKKVEQSLFSLPRDAGAAEDLRRQVLNGAYRLHDVSHFNGYRPGENAVHLFTCGAMAPEAVTASKRLLLDDIFVNVINVTGPGPLYRAYQQSVRAALDRQAGVRPFLGDVIRPEERGAPIVTVLDGHPHALAWLGSALGARSVPLGVTGFGQSGSRPELYREYGIDTASIQAACHTALGQ